MRREAGLVKRGLMALVLGLAAAGAAAAGEAEPGEAKVVSCEMCGGDGLMQKPGDETGMVPCECCKAKVRGGPKEPNPVCLRCAGTGLRLADICPACKGTGLLLLTLGAKGRPAETPEGLARRAEVELAQKRMDLKAAEVRLAAAKAELEAAEAKLAEARAAAGAAEKDKAEKKGDF